MIEARGLSKRYGNRTAVHGLDFTVRPGVVTGFLGPNGAGKSTTMRMVLGLDRPTEGTALVCGRPYRELRAPLRHVGALLDAKAVHGGRTARDHLRCLARANAIPAARVSAVLETVGLAAVADRPCRGFSLGMSQRLGVAAALLGDPAVLGFDEPVNGLDPEGVRWIRTLMRGLAAEGRTVFVSSHLMSEMALTAGHLIVIGRGRILADTGMREFIEAHSEHCLRLRTPRPDVLCPLLVRRGLRVEREPDGAFRVRGASAPAVGEIAAVAGVALHELSPVRVSLEEAFMRLTSGSVEYHANTVREAA